MRVVVQRVVKASVSVGDELVSDIGRGLCILVGISREDTKQDVEYITNKVLRLRLFDGENDKRWDKSVTDKNFEVLCVSQFTLYGLLKGNKPDFHLAMDNDKSEGFYQEFVDHMRLSYKSDKVKDGRFAAFMQVHIQNDGPVTLNIESPPLTAQEREKYARKQQRSQAAKSSKQKDKSSKDVPGNVDQPLEEANQSENSISQAAESVKSQMENVKLDEDNGQT